MSVIGIDIGTSYCVLATVQRGAVTILRNDLSERLTPTLVGFTDRERHIGESAQTHIKSNYRNTCRHIKQLLGLTCVDQEAIDIERQYALAPLDFGPASEGGLAGYRVMYRGQEQVMTATRCLAVILTKLKETAERSTGFVIRDVAIGVPAWYTDRARQAILDAAEIADLNCLRAVNEHTAVALDYGIYRSATFDADQPTRVVFVGIGHGSTNVSVVDFTRSRLRVLAVATDKHLGGRNMDQAIIGHFAGQFQKRHGVSPLTSTKAVLKLEDAAIRMKTMLSANTEAPIHIECLVEDHDLTGMLTRQDFETLCAPLKQRLVAVLKTAFSEGDPNLDPMDVQHIEVVGGCTRIPWVQETLLDFFARRLPVSKTLNMDEAVARGCALQAAMLDPRYRVRDYEIIDVLLEPVTVIYPSSSDDPNAAAYKSSVMFQRGCPLGTKKSITLTKHSQDFEIRLVPGPPAGSPLRSKIELPRREDIPPFAIAPRVKVHAALSLHATVGWDSAQLLVDEEIDEMVVEKRPLQRRSPEQSMKEEEEEQPESPPPLYEEVQVPKRRIKVHKIPCKITQLESCRPGYTDRAVIASLRSMEEQMEHEDAEQQRLRETINDLESYIYKMQATLTDGLRDFVSPEEAPKVLAALDRVHTWLYDTPDASRDVYKARLKELQALCEPISERQQEYVDRGEAIQEALQTIADLRACECSPEWQHIEPEKMRSLVMKLDEVNRWVQHVAAYAQTQPLYADPATRVATIRQERDMVLNFSKTILVPPAAQPSAPVEEGPVTKVEAGDAEMVETEEHGAAPSSTAQATDGDADAPMA